MAASLLLASYRLLQSFHSPLTVILRMSASSSISSSSNAVESDEIASVDDLNGGDNAPDPNSSSATTTSLTFATLFPLIVSIISIILLLLTLLFLYVHSRRSRVSSTYYHAVRKGNIRCYGSQAGFEGDEGDDEVEEENDEIEERDAEKAAAASTSSSAKTTEKHHLTHLVGRIVLALPKTAAAASPTSSSSPSSPSSPSSSPPALIDTQLSQTFPHAIRVRRIVSIFVTPQDVREERLAEDEADDETNSSAPSSPSSPSSPSTTTLNPLQLTRENWLFYKSLLPLAFQSDAIFTRDWTREKVWLETTEREKADTSGKSKENGKQPKPSLTKKTKYFQINEDIIRQYFNFFIIHPLEISHVRETLPRQLAQALSHSSTTSTAASSTSSSSSHSHPHHSSLPHVTSLYFGAGTSTHPKRGDIKIEYFVVPSSGCEALGNQEDDEDNEKEEEEEEEKDVEKGGMNGTDGTHHKKMNGHSSTSKSATKDTADENHTISILCEVTEDGSIQPYTHHLGESTSSTSRNMKGNKASESTPLLPISSKSKRKVSSTKPASPITLATRSLASTWSLLPFFRSSSTSSHTTHETQPIFYVDLGVKSVESMISKRVENYAEGVTKIRLTSLISMFLPLRYLISQETTASPLISALIALLASMATHLLAYVFTYWKLHAKKSFWAFCIAVTMISLIWMEAPKLKGAVSNHNAGHIGSTTAGGNQTNSIW